MSRSCSLLCMKWFPFWPRFAWTQLRLSLSLHRHLSITKESPALAPAGFEPWGKVHISDLPATSSVSNTTIPNVTGSGSCLERTEYEAAKTVKKVRRGQRQRAAFLFVLFQSNNTWACTDLRHSCDRRNKHYCLPKHVRKKHKEWLMKEVEMPHICHENQTN